MSQSAPLGRRGLQGPFDLRWLLERVVDFGPEEPSWRQRQVSRTVGPPPPPLQLLLPEVLTFDEKGEPQSLFFSDRGGYLRGIDRPFRKGQALIHGALEKVLRQRQQLERERDTVASAAEAGQELRGGSALGSRKVPQQLLPPGTAPARSMTSQRDTSSVKGTDGGVSPTSTSPPSLVPSISERRKQPRRKPWRLTLRRGEELTLSEHEVAACFNVAPGQAGSWPSGAYCLHACFWIDGTAPERRRAATEYFYDAQNTVPAGAKHDSLGRIKQNHFERFGFLDSVRDRNLISALPLLLAQHFAYYYSLELMSGHFCFLRDRAQQLWLVEAQELYLVPKLSAMSVRNAPKLFRYLSEEALQNLPLGLETGQRCQDMVTLMQEHYQHFKRMLGMDVMLRKENDVLESNIPVLEGTDLKAMASFWGIAERPPPVSVEQRSRYLPAVPKRPKERVKTSRPKAKPEAREIRQACGTPKDAVEVVLSQQGAQLLAGAGPGQAPLGPTLDALGLGALCPDGTGLTLRRHVVQSVTRVVSVPEGSGTKALEIRRRAQGAAAAS